MMADEEGHASSREWDLSADWLDLNSISWVSELIDLWTILFHSDLMHRQGFWDNIVDDFNYGPRE
jgi:hypothetical protein